MQYDYIKFDEAELPLQPNGFLNILSNLTRTGVFTYINVAPDGSTQIVRQLRHPDEVFAEEAMESLMGLPATIEHPVEEDEKILVSPENAHGLVVGMASDRPKKISLDGDPEEYVQQLVTFFDKDAIGQIQSGKRRELSLGYLCDHEETPGVWKGIAYDVIQRRIQYNHLSLVDRARGGPQCRVITDSEKQHVMCDGLTLLETIGRDEMKVFTIDGVDHKVDDGVHAILTAQKEAKEKAQADLVTRQASFDKLQAEHDSLKAEKDKATSAEAEAKRQEEFKSKVQARVSLENKAGVILDSADISEDSEREIKEKVIKKISPDVVLDGKSDAYVDARFDIAVEGYKKPNEGERKIGDKLTQDGGDTVTDSATVRAKAWEKAKAMGRDPIKLKA